MGLEIREVVKRFGGLTAVDDVSLSIADSEMHCIIGPNGAGKTTLLSLITGELPVTSGEVWLDDVRLDGRAPYEVARLGVLRKFQVPAIFDELTVRANLAVAVHGTVPVTGLFGRRNGEADQIESVLHEVRLSNHASTTAGDLPHGLVQWLEIGMVIINRPRVLLLDEPTAGMSRAETAETADLLASIARTTNSTMIIVEHDMDFVRRVGERITVLHEGRVLTQGDIEAVEADPEVREVYLGTRTEEQQT